MLIELGMDVNKGNPELNDFTDSGRPLHVAAIYGICVPYTSYKAGSAEAMRLLIDAKAEVNTGEGPFGNTPLILAVIHDQPECLEVSF
jgi:ankyrin repeat protein